MAAADRDSCSLPAVVYACRPTGRLGSSPTAAARWSAETSIALAWGLVFWGWTAMGFGVYASVLNLSPSRPLWWLGWSGFLMGKFHSGSWWFYWGLDFLCLYLIFWISVSVTSPCFAGVVVGCGCSGCWAPLVGFMVDAWFWSHEIWQSVTAVLYFHDVGIEIWQSSCRYVKEVFWFIWITKTGIFSSEKKKFNKYVFRFKKIMI